ncbi:F-box domain-containing protein [Mycena kentingensis (nom. inval.)]|nr:F-box domain-containing protein [Mycena kentingensis (nom. inval.)]
MTIELPSTLARMSMSTPESREADRIRLSELEALLAPLRAEYEEVSSRLDAYKYPIATIPAEILSEIFLQTLPGYPGCPVLLVPTENEAGDDDGAVDIACCPTQLTHVCREWRVIAHATPGLWRAIQMGGDTDGNRTHSARMDEARMWLLRSGSLPLSIAMGKDECEGRREAAIYALLGSSTSRHRVQHLTVQLPPNYKHWLDGGFGTLVVLDVRQADMDDASGPDAVGVLDAPRLREVFFTAHDNRWFRQFLPCIPWAQLTRLRTRYITAGVAMEILRETRSLLELRLEMEMELDQDDVPSDAPRLPLPNLTSLILETTNTKVTPPMTRLLRALQTPALKQLYIEENLLDGFDGDDPAEANLVALLQTLAPVAILERLEVAGGTFDILDYPAALLNTQLFRYHTDVYEVDDNPMQWGFWEGDARR